MGVVQGSITYTRFFVWGEVPDDYRDRYVDAIMRNVFTPLLPELDDEEHVGWCSVHHPFDLDLTYDKLFQNNFLNVALRLDRWAIPGPVMRAHLSRAEAELLQTKQRERLGRRERTELREFVVKQLRKKTFPAMKVVDLSWDMEAGVLRFWNTSDKMHERLHELFEHTFELKLVPASPYTTAIRLGLSEEQADNFRHLQETVFSEGEL